MAEADEEPEIVELVPEPPDTRKVFEGSGYSPRMTTVDLDSIRAPSDGPAPGAQMNASPQETDTTQGDLPPND